MADPYPVQPAQQHPKSHGGLLQGADSTAVYQGYYSKGSSGSSDNLKEAAGLERRSSSSRECLCLPSVAICGIHAAAAHDNSRACIRVSHMAAVQVVMGPEAIVATGLLNTKCRGSPLNKHCSLVIWQ